MAYDWPLTLAGIEQIAGGAVGAPLAEGEHGDAVVQAVAGALACLVGLGVLSVTHPFCGDCDRSRLTSDGPIRNCLFARTETPLRDLMRAGSTYEELAAVWAGAMWVKKPGHGIDDEGFLQPDRPMSAIGG